MRTRSTSSPTPGPGVLESATAPRQGSVAPPLVTVVIVNWNGAHLLPDCLDALAAQDLPDGQLAVWWRATTPG